MTIANTIQKIIVTLCRQKVQLKRLFHSAQESIGVDNDFSGGLRMSFFVHLDDLRNFSGFQTFFKFSIEFHKQRSVFSVECKSVFLKGKRITQYFKGSTLLDENLSRLRINDDRIKFS